VTDAEHGYVDALWQTEKSGHVALKNRAYMVLMSLGFSSEQIDEERYFGKKPVDMVGERDDGSLVMVECESYASNPPKTGQVSYNGEQYRDGHQTLALTEDGLFELVGAELKHFVPKNIQTAVSPANSERIGRWRANGIKKSELREWPDHRPQPDGVEQTYEGMYADNHRRWKANGNEPLEEQPGLFEMARMYDAGFSDNEPQS